jgi:hypothetical protein
LNGKPRADDGTEEEGKECRGKEWGKHAIFYYTRQKEGGRKGGRVRGRMPRKRRR